MKNHAVLDLSGAAISNRIVVYGCTLRGGHSYSGNLDVDGGNLTLDDPTCADNVTVTNGGDISGSSLDANNVTVPPGTAGDETRIDSALTIQKTLIVEGDDTLNLSGSLTQCSGSTLIIRGKGKLKVEELVTIEENANIITTGEHEVGAELIDSNNPIDIAEDVILNLGDKEIILHDGDTSLIIINYFNPDLARIYTAGNWGP